MKTETRSSSELARTRYIEGLRQLADMLESSPDVPLPHAAGTDTHLATRINWYFHTRARFDAFVDAFPSDLVYDEDKADRDDSFPHVFRGDLGGLHIAALCAGSLANEAP